MQRGWRPQPAKLDSGTLAWNLENKKPVTILNMHLLKDRGRAKKLYQENISQPIFSGVQKCSTCTCSPFSCIFGDKNMTTISRHGAFRLLRSFTEMTPLLLHYEYDKGIFAQQKSRVFLFFIPCSKSITVDKTK